MQKLIVVCGPTASGKTKRAIEIAKAVEGEIICADSMQIYNNMPICTASPTAEEKAEVPHHLFNFVPLNENFTVTKYAKLAHAKIEEVANRGKLPILVGGTGLYIDSVTKNRKFTNIDVPSETRLELESKTNEELFEDLKRIDSASYNKIALQNRRRLIRALEIYYATGITKTEVDKKTDIESRYNVDYIGTYYGREELYERIDGRVDLIVEEGLIEEVKHIFDMHFNESFTALQALGCKELFPYFEGEISLENALENIKQSTKHYAKRQMTWFKRNKKIIWVRVN